MTIEQKAKAYDAAINKAESLYKASEPMSGCNVIIETLFPELKESEDEKIRKALIKFHKSTIDIDGIKGNEIVAWLENIPYTIDHEKREGFHLGYKAALEKQGKQKSKFCHHEVDFSGCSEEYRKAYYDGWNNCNQQHSQLKAEQKPAWSEEDEKMCQETIDWFEKKCFPYALENDNPARESIKWLKSLKEKIGE